MAKIYQGNESVEIKLHCGVDTTSATTREIKVKKPDASTVIWTATQLGTSEFVYNTTAGDLDQAGSYLLQASIVMPTFTGLGDTVTMTVTAPYA